MNHTKFIVWNLWRAFRRLFQGRASLLAIFVLATGIGMCTAVFSLAQAVIFHPLPFPKQDSLRVIWKADPKSGIPFLELAYPELSDLQGGVPAFDSVAVMPTTLYGYGKVLQVANHEPVQIESAPVSHDFFRTLGVAPVLGRDFKGSDEHPGAEPVVIVSHQVWRTQFGGDMKIIGRQITLNRQGYTVIGVMASGVDFPKGVGLWAPLGVHQNLDDRNDYYLQAIARVKPGYSDEQVHAQVNGLFRRLARAYRQYYSPTQQAVITSLSQYWIGSARLQLLVSLGASFLLLITACVTVSNLLLSRTLGRRQEIATCSSLGASTSQILMQFFAEGLTAAFVAGIAGIAIAWAIIKLLSALAPPDIPRLADAGIQWEVLGFAITLSFLAAIACSAAPTFIAIRMNLETVLREESARTTGTRRGQRLQNMFITAQVAITVVLLAASFLIVMSVRSMLRTDIGFAHRDAVTMNLALRGSQADSQRMRLFYTHLLNQLREYPIVTSVGAVLVRPLEGTIGWGMNYESEFDVPGSVENLPVSNFEVITPGYFQTVGTALLVGRDFTSQDRENTEKVVIISSGLAERMRRSGHEPIGTRIRLGKRHQGDWWKIIGITGNTRYRGVVARDEDIYVCYLQTGIPVNYLVIRGRGTPNELTALVRNQIAALDPTQAIANVATIGQLVNRDTARQRFNMVLLLGFGWTALLLAAAGVYSVVTEMISLRTREIAIRLSLGSRRSALIRRLMGSTLQFVIMGELAGLFAALMVGRVVSGLLYGIKPGDPVISITVLLFVLITSAVAAWIPAWIASGQSPRQLLQ